MLTPFDIRFFRELKTLLEDEIAEFPDKASAAGSYCEVRYEVGYRDALREVIAQGEELERRLTSGQD